MILAIGVAFVTGLSLARGGPVNLDVQDYWDVNATASNSATGYHWADLYAVYSGTPSEIIHCRWVDAPTHENLTTPCNDTRFTSNQVSDTSADQGKPAGCITMLPTTNM